MTNHSFSVYFPLDNQHNPFITYPQQSGWPISTIERMFDLNVSFGNYRIGVTNIDPTSCYKTTCPNTIDSIVKEEPVIIDGITSRKVIAKISQKGGGIIMPGEINDSILYIIPYESKFIVIFNYYPDTDFDKFVKSFQVKKNTIPFKTIDPNEL